MNTLLSSFEPRDPVGVVGYADDLLLYIKGSDELRAHHGATHGGGSGASDYMGEVYGFVFNPTKTTIDY